MKAIEIENLSVKLNNYYILKDITFSIDEGGITYIIGPNGAGKTTLIRAIIGLIPKTGSVRIFGIPFEAKSQPLNLIGYVPQRLDFDRTIPMTVIELLNLSLPSFGIAFSCRKRDEERIEEALSLVGAIGLLRKRIGGLSDGELQRVLIARALLNNPKILFLDEPSSGIDIEGQERFYDLISRLKIEHGITSVLISHDLGIVYRHADSIICLNKTICCQGGPEILTAELIKSVYGEMAGAYVHRG